MSTKTSLTYEKAQEELQEILEKLQAEAVSIDDLTSQVQRAAELIAFCQNKLRDTEVGINDILNKME